MDIIAGEFAGIVAGADRADGLAHGKGARGGDSLAEEGRVGALIKALAQVGGTAEQGDIAGEIIDEQA